MTPGARIRKLSETMWHSYHQPFKWSSLYTSHQALKRRLIPLLNIKSNEAVGYRGTV